MNGLEYNIISEWRREIYVQATGDMALAHVPTRVQQLWDDFHTAHQLDNDMKINEFDRILSDFQSHGWLA
ncbi:hypothetical protein AB3K25_08200 [Leuconostoc sp. MS02]|uniref:Glucose-inhibited division protein B n=1 Tax=Leuconostoc aquikimchii TaxID=3236804 RepID=A0ABV3S137_9LACO